MHIPILNISRKVKSMQMFRQSVEKAYQGDRVGICVTQFDPKLFERGVICAPDLGTIANAAIINVKKISYFKHAVKTKAKFHITLGHETIMATISCFAKEHFDKNEVCNKLSTTFNYDLEYKYFDELLENEKDNENNNEFYLLLEFEKPVLVIQNCLVIGSKLDMDINSPGCRLAFWGNVVDVTKDKNYKTTFLPNLKVFKIKQKEGVVERMVNQDEVIVKNIFKKETDTQQFIGLLIALSTGEVGKIESQFGQSGKVKVYFKDGLNATTSETLKQKNKIIKVRLEFKRYVYDVNKQMIQ